MRPAVCAKWAGCAAAVALVATGCGGGTAGPGGSAVVSASWGDPQNPLEPANTNEVQGGKVLEMLLRGLKRYDPETGAAKNVLAEKIETIDAQHYTVTLKRGWSFSDGEKVTAKSFVDAWNYGALLDNKQKNAPFFQYIDGFDKVHPDNGKPTAKTLSGLKVKDDHTFDVTLNQKFSSWPDTLGYSAFMPLPQAFFRDHAGWLKRPVGNGPYLVDSYTKGSVLKMRKWKRYPGPDPAQNGGIDLRVYTDSETAYTDLQAGNLDLVDDIPASQLKNVRSDLGDRYLNQPAGIIQTLTFPMYDAHWGKPGMERVRRGLSMAIDREQITKEIFQHTRTPATDWTSPVLGEKGGFKEGLCGDACVFDPAKARQLIKDGGGLPGGRMTITYNADTGSHKDWVDAVCNSINKTLGNDKACVGNPVGTFADFRNQISARQLTGPFRAGWQMDYPLIQNFLQPLYYTNASSNDGKFSNPDFDKLVNQANAAPDTRQAVAKFQDAERILAREMPSIPLWYQNGSGGYSDRISNVRLNPFSVPVYNEITVG
ncbi:peptide ABC transporter substrate-binding protein [Streptomyces noursei ZPM]|uniref:Peptide ABC transporter substrate-binding protein n=1 Tax=Streptomyces noursei TaxID=1971 RepID=A0A401R6X4_STRNR|nr:ABC transporter substrate-binding protein [Streptomyces noursei]AKA05833.1 peptide ABC transporter substrate-binding protein [Streptomyces noursei ZPM]EXU90953.1 peptide ABC transporter substrate-binding protein [Streptomyces noursei PD-1]UWS74239.1 ABC transporter substrate-binding protein [Streptomyces noursei]GCB93376.1 peptide ABC transporter substrate-binding protein [Streptomyces noursei]